MPLVPNCNQVLRLRVQAVDQDAGPSASIEPGHRNLGANANVHRVVRLRVSSRWVSQPFGFLARFSKPCYANAGACRRLCRLFGRSRRGQYCSQEESDDHLPVPVQHCVNRRAGNEKRLLVRFNALFCGLFISPLRSRPALGWPTQTPCTCISMDLHPGTNECSLSAICSSEYREDRRGDLCGQPSDAHIHRDRLRI